jgi:hypothetical protein
MPSHLDIGRVFGRAFGAIRRHWRAFGLYGLLYGCLYLGIYALPQLPGVSRLFVQLGSAGLQLLIAQPLIKALVGWTMWADFVGSPSKPGATFRAVGRQAVWVLLTSALALTAEIVGLAALAAPGVFLMSALAASILACTIEKLTPWQAVRRSFDLTRGQRWRTFALIFAILVIELVIYLGVSLVWVTTGAFGLMSSIGLAGVTNVAVFIGLLEAILLGVFVSACDGALYIELRRLKEGPGAEATAELFA